MHYGNAIRHEGDYIYTKYIRLLADTIPDHSGRAD
jgi:hypothetical protein